MPNAGIDPPRQSNALRKQALYLQATTDVYIFHHIYYMKDKTQKKTVFKANK